MHPEKSETQLPNEDSENKEKKISRREFLKKLAATLGSLTAAESALSGCAVKVLREELPEKIEKEKPPEEDSREELEKILQGMSLYQELSQNPDIKLKIVFDNTLYNQGILAAYEPDFFNVFQYKGTLRITPFSELEKEDKAAIESTIYHELVHIQQDYEIWNYYQQDNRYNLPEWKIKFYFAKLPKEKTYRIGAELDAGYKQALFEAEKQNKIDQSTLDFFFAHYLKIRRTEAYKKFPEIKKLASDQYNKITEISGYTLESYIKERIKR